MYFKQLSNRAAQRQILKWRNLCFPALRDIPVWDYAGHQIQVMQFDPAFSPAGSKVALHQHSFYEAIIVLAGFGWSYPAKRQKLVPGSVLINSPHELHGWEAPDSALVRLGVWFSITPAVPIKAEFSRGEQSQIVSDASDMLRLVQSSHVGWRECFSARLVLLFASLLKAAEWPEPKKEMTRPREERRFGSLVNQFLEDNFSRPISLSDIAVNFGISVPTLTRYLRSEGHQGAMASLLEIRMERAATKLKISSDSICAIARQVGIPDPSYFDRCFRKYFGRSPQAFRNLDTDES